MLREYQIENFKAFAGPETIPIRPITLIFGPNSSGKSAILQSLLLLKQTLEEADISTPLLSKGSLVDLGNYREFVHRHEVEKEFSFKALFTFEKDDDTSWLRELLGITDTTLIGLKSRFRCENEAIKFSSAEIFVEDTQAPLLSHDFLDRMADGRFLTETQINETHALWRVWWGRVKKETKGRIEILESNEKLSQRSSFYLEDLSADLDEYPFEEALRDLQRESCYASSRCQQFLPAHVEASRDTLELDSPFAKTFSGFDEFGQEVSSFDQGLNPFLFSLEICSAFQRLLGKLVYLGPLRSYPERYYAVSGNLSEQVGQRGERLPELLYQKRENLLTAVNAELERFGLGYRLQVSVLKDEDLNSSNVFALRVVDKKTEVSASIRDVGFGVSQVLPVVVQSLLSQNKTLLIEQPEIHLHPALQAELGDLFIKSALGAQKNTFILETHSEHLMLRILRRIRETTEGELEPGLTPIRPEDVAVLYVQPGTDGSKIIEIPIRPDGEFAEQWPQGFFAERAKELF